MTAGQQSHWDQHGELRLEARPANRRPATHGRALRFRRPPVRSAAVRKPLWPCVKLTKTAGKASAGMRASAGDNLAGFKIAQMAARKAPELKPARSGAPEGRGSRRAGRRRRENRADRTTDRNRARGRRAPPVSLVCFGVIGARRLSFADFLASRPDLAEIGAKRASEAIVSVLRRRDQKQDRAAEHRQEKDRIDPKPRWCQPKAGFEAQGHETSRNGHAGQQ